MMTIQTQVDMGDPFRWELPTLLRAIAQVQRPRPQRIVRPRVGLAARPRLVVLHDVGPLPT